MKALLSSFLEFLKQGVVLLLQTVFNGALLLLGDFDLIFGLFPVVGSLLGALESGLELALLNSEVVPQLLEILRVPGLFPDVLEPLLELLLLHLLYELVHLDFLLVLIVQAVLAHGEHHALHLLQKVVLHGVPHRVVVLDQLGVVTDHLRNYVLV